MGDICTTRAGSAEEAAVLPAFTAATFAPLAIAKMPDDTDVIVRFEERMTVGLDERTTDRGGLKDETWTTRPAIVEVTTLDGAMTVTVTGAEVEPFDIGEPTCVR